MEQIYFSQSLLWSHMPFLGWLPVFFKFIWIPKLFCFSLCEGLLPEVNSNHVSLHLCSLGLQGSPSGPHRSPSVPACPAESLRWKMAGVMRMKAYSKCSQNFPPFLQAAVSSLYFRCLDD